MIIREMKSADLDLVVSFEKEFRETDEDNKIPFNEDEYRRRFSLLKIEDYEDTKSLLYIDDNKIIGQIDFLTQISFSGFKKVGYIDWIRVLKPFRSKGIAKLLFEEAEAFFRKEKCELFSLFIDDTDIAKGFYKSINLKHENVIRGYKLLDK